MTTTIATTQTGQIAVTTVDTTTMPLSVSAFLPAAALYRFQLSTTTYFTYPLEFTATISSVSGEEEFFILILKDPDIISLLSNGVLAADSVPEAFSPIHGTAESFELARKTITVAGAITFNLDLAYVTRIMASSTAYLGGWNGSLLLWLCAEQQSLGSWSNASMSAYGVVDYPNRDTGGPGLHRSRYSRCPVSGIKVPRGKMVLDGYRGILVHPDAYDPPEPEAREWDDIVDENEGL